MNTRELIIQHTLMLRWWSVVLIVWSLIAGWALVHAPTISAQSCGPNLQACPIWDRFICCPTECPCMIEFDMDSPVCGSCDPTPTPGPTATPTPTPTPAGVYTIHVAPSTGCTVYAKDGGIDVVETPNGMACAGGMTTIDPLCTEQFKNFALTMLKVVTDPGYMFTGWTVNGAAAKQAAGPLFLTIRPGLASRADLLPPGTTEMNVEIGCPPPPTVEIVSADVTHNQIQVRLGPAGAAGTLMLELRDPDTYVIVNAQPRTGSADIQHETFGLDAWNDDAIGRYERLRATWTVGALQAQDELAFPAGMRIDVLGIYKHTQYNTPNEADCSGVLTNFAYTDDPSFNCRDVKCDAEYWHQGTAKLGWLQDAFSLSGGGYSTSLGYVTREWQCQKSTCPFQTPAGICDYRFRKISQPCPLCQGVSLTANQSVAVMPKHDYLKCGDIVYVHGIGVRTVHDVGSDVIEKQLDHYVGVSGCGDPTYNEQHLTMKLY